MTVAFWCINLALILLSRIFRVNGSIIKYEPLGIIFGVAARASLHSRIVCVVAEESSNACASDIFDFLKDPPEVVKYAHKLTPFFYFKFGREG